MASKKMTKEDKNQAVQEILEEQASDPNNMAALLERVKMLEALLEETTKRVASKGSKAVPGTSKRCIEVLQQIQNGPISILDIASNLTTSECIMTSKNVSSVLTALKKAGHVIHTDCQGRKYIADKQVLPEPPASVEVDAAGLDNAEKESSVTELQ